MAQHTSRQRAHLLSCQTYLNSMREQGLETSITRQASDPAAFFKSQRLLAVNKVVESKTPKIPKLPDYPMAVRIQAVALAEASLTAERVHEITGIEPRLLSSLRKLARDRGYDPNVSMQLKEEYVLDPPNTKGPRGRPRKRRAEDDFDPAITRLTQRPAPAYLGPDGLPPGDWNFMAPTMAGPAHDTF